MQPVTLLSSVRPVDADIYVGIITSDYQVRIRGGRYMGFDNASWTEQSAQSLLFDGTVRSMRVDVDHKRGATISGAIIAIDVAAAEDGARFQADWTAARPMDYVLAVFSLPRGMPAAHKAKETAGCVGISIEHGGRKPRRTIGPYVTVTHRPWNQDCWMVYDEHRDFVYPYLKHMQRLPQSLLSRARQLLSSALELPSGDVSWRPVQHQTS